MNTKKNGSLNDMIIEVLKTGPTNDSVEDTLIEEPQTKLVDVSSVDTIEDENQLISKFRKRNIDLLADIDDRYAGEKGSRRIVSEETDEDDDEENENEIQQDTSDEDSSAIDEESENDNIDDASSSSSVEEESEFQNIKHANKSSEQEKGKSIRNQISIWESLLELRIQFQKCLGTANRMPQPDLFNKIKQNSTKEFTKINNEAKSSLSNVFEKLLLLQNLLLNQFPETKTLNQKSKDNNNKSLDEEIPSDTEEEIDNEDEEIMQPKKKMKLSHCAEELNKRHEKYRGYRNGVIEKWNLKTRNPIIKNNQTTHSVVSQIEHNLADPSKLLKKTQTKRSEYQILGQEHGSVNETDTEIFDDDDFYHQLLRELIEVKSADVTNPVQLSRQWIQLQNMRSKMKRKIDTRATKGRKIRYAVHSKLVNFMAPIVASDYTEEAKTDLYNSLFGKAC